MLLDTDTLARGVCLTCGLHTLVNHGVCWGCSSRPLDDDDEEEAYDCDYGEHPLPPEPTTAYPGTPDRMAVYALRLASGFALHHPDDLRLERAGTDGLTREIPASWRKPGVGPTPRPRPRLVRCSLDDDGRRDEAA